MSDAQHDEHEPLIKTPKQLIIAVVAAFAVPILIIILLANYVGLGVKEGAGSSGMSEEAVNDRIKPVAHLELKDANAPRVFKTGEQLYKEVCATCHAAGIAGAPKFGDAASWGPRLPQGLDGLTKVALAGKGGMPARGGTSPDDVSDYELERAIVYMANSGGAKFQEPAAPAGGAAAPAASATEAAAPAAPAAAAAAPAAAAPAPNPAYVNPINTMWVLVTAFLVFFMQAGFMFLEAGFARTRETVNVLLEGVVDTCLCGILFWAFGFAWMFGHGNGYIGWGDGNGHSWYFLQNLPDTYEGTGVATLAFFLFQFAFADTCSTITSGAMLGRTGFWGDLWYSIGVSGFLYPIFGHWAWGPDGWLNAIPFWKAAPFHDFAGSTVVHTIGGSIALAGAIVLGPRLGRKFKRDGGGPMAGHDMTIAAVGAVILWFGWYGFNPGSQQAISGATNYLAVANAAVGEEAHDGGAGEDDGGGKRERARQRGGRHPVQYSREAGVGTSS